MASPTIPTTHITTHSPSGLSTFRTLNPRPVNESVALLYSTSGFPANFTDVADIKGYETVPVKVFPKSGAKVATCEWPPGGSDTKASPIHRTLSLDIGVITAGEGELLNIWGHW
jgi:hypothetical protein